MTTVVTEWCVIMSSCIIYFSGNKADQINKIEIPTHIGAEYAKRYEMRFIETSAKDADNVDKLFYDIARELTKHARENALDPTPNVLFPSGGSTSISGFNCCKM